MSLAGWLYQATSQLQQPGYTPCNVMAAVTGELIINCSQTCCWTTKLGMQDNPCRT